MVKFKIEQFSSLKKWITGDGSLEISWNGYNNTLCISDFRCVRKENKLEYPNDPDVNVKRQWGVRTNGAKKGVKEHTCFDWYLMLGHIEINYTNWNYNKDLIENDFEVNSYE